MKKREINKLQKIARKPKLEILEICIRIRRRSVVSLEFKNKAEYQELSAFQYLENNFGKYGNVKHCAKKKAFKNWKFTTVLR